MVSVAVWDSKRFRSLPTDSARLFYLYSLSNVHQNSAGCFRLPDGYACDDLCWSAEKYREAREANIAAGLIQFDAETSEILVERWFKHSPPTNEKHNLGIARAVERIASPVLRNTALEALRESWAAVLQKKAPHTNANGHAAESRPYALTGTPHLRRAT